MSLTKLSRNHEASKRRLAARRKFAREGVTIADWARERGFSPRLVYTLLSSDRRAIRGASHRVAVALGLKTSAGVVD